MTAAIIALAFLAPQQDQYPVYESDRTPPAELRQRRERLMQQMEPGSAAIIFTNPERNRNNDTDYLFRPDSDFLYLAGFDEPSAALVLVPDGVTYGGKRVREALFVNESSAMSITWLGYRMGPQGAMRLLGVELALPGSEFASVLPKLLAGSTVKKLSIVSPPDPSGTIASMLQAAREWRTSTGAGEGPALRARIEAMRGVKSATEIAFIKKAAEISARGHAEAMRSAIPGMREYEIAAIVRYVFARQGAEFEGYPAICGAGVNSTILHYNTNRGPTEAGQVMLVDAAAEYRGYSADVTRTFPISGKWSKEQRAIYEVVLRAQNAGIALCRPGVNQQQISRAVSDELAKGLTELGLIKERSELSRFYMHGFGHGIGLDVHDPSPGTLQAGVTLSVEPGIYIKPGSPVDKKWWNIGVRIEDDVLVTQSGPVILSAGAPRDPDAIEKVMAETGIGNVPLRK